MPISPRKNETATVLPAWESMNDQQLDRNFRSVGGEVFVAYFTEFCDRSRSNEDVAVQIEEERGYTEKSCRSRTSHARSIIGAGRATDALAMVSRSATPRVPDHIKIRSSEFVRERESGLISPRDSSRRRHRPPIAGHHPGAGLSNTDNRACAKAYGNGKDKSFFGAEIALKVDYHGAVDRLRHDRMLNGNPWSTVPRPVKC